MNAYKAVLTDVDGTLVDSKGRVTDKTAAGIREWIRAGGRYAIVSGRFPQGIYPILRKYDLACPIICYSGGLIMNEKKEIIHNVSMPMSEARDVVHFIKKKGYDLALGLYSLESWYSEDTEDARVQNEMAILDADATPACFEDFPDEMPVNKFMCICNEDEILDIEAEMKEAFPQHAIVKSSPILLEVMRAGINKGDAVRRLCRYWGIGVDETVVFGDSYNDMEMLEIGGCTIVMGNAPEDIRAKFSHVTEDNDHDGIYYGMKSLGLIP